MSRPCCYGATFGKARVVPQTRRLAGVGCHVGIGTGRPPPEPSQKAKGTPCGRGVPPETYIGLWLSLYWLCACREDTARNRHGRRFTASNVVIFFTMLRPSRDFEETKIGNLRDGNQTATGQSDSIRNSGLRCIS